MSDFEFQIPHISKPKSSLPRWVNSEHIEIPYGGNIGGLRVDGSKVIGPEDSEWARYAEILDMLGHSKPSEPENREE